MRKQPCDPAPFVAVHEHQSPSDLAVSATLHCLTGCAIGEVLGMIVGTALGFSTLGTVVLSVALAFLFGYALTSLPLLRAGLALSRRHPHRARLRHGEHRDDGDRRQRDHAARPGAIDAGAGDLLFWGSLSFALAIAGVVAVPVNGWLIARGRGHAVVHETGIHGGPDTRVVGAIFVGAFCSGRSSCWPRRWASGSPRAPPRQNHARRTAAPCPARAAPRASPRAGARRRGTRAAAGGSRGSRRPRPAVRSGCAAGG